MSIDLSTLLGVCAIAGTVIGAAVAFGLFRYRLDRHDEKLLAIDGDVAANKAEITKLQLWRATQRGAEKALRGDAIDTTMIGRPGQ